MIGLGYVGLPLAVEFGKHYPTIGFDINAKRIKQLRVGLDETREVMPEEIRQSNGLTFTTDPAYLNDCNVYVVTVPTPIDKHKRPDLSALLSASETIGKFIKPNSVVIYESTVYPGVTEEECVPVIERTSRLKYNKDFYAGYSPERINPGDKEHRLPNIVKVTSGSTPETADFVDQLYKSIIPAGTHKVSSIRIAEAAKVIENTQRDINIALINELAIIFNKLNIDTDEVLQAAGTKWNFLPFKPGLVGGHCIGIDPYYLTFKAQEIGYSPEMILAGRKLNDQMGNYVADQIIRKMLLRKIHVSDSDVLVLGVTFKENCPDIRNSRVVDVVHEFLRFGANVDIYDPITTATDIPIGSKKLPILNLIPNKKYDAIILAVTHREIVQISTKRFKDLSKDNCVRYAIRVPAELRNAFEVL